MLDLHALRLDHIRRAPFPAPLAELAAGRYELDPAAVTTLEREALDVLLPLALVCAGRASSVTEAAATVRAHYS